MRAASSQSDSEGEEEPAGDGAEGEFAARQGRGSAESGAGGVVGGVAMLQDSAWWGVVGFQAVVLTMLPVPWPFWMK